MTTWRALRRAFWAASRSIGHLDVILDIAGTGLHLHRLAEALADGRARRSVFDDHQTAGGNPR